jgi:hypothetical protein
MNMIIEAWLQVVRKPQLKESKYGLNSRDSIVLLETIKM